MRPFVTRPLAALLAILLGATTCAERALHELTGLHAANCTAHVATCDDLHDNSHELAHEHSHEHSCPSSSGDCHRTARGEPNDSHGGLKTAKRLHFAAQHDHGDCVVCRYLMSSSLAPTYCEAPSVEWLPNERTIGDDRASPAQFFLSVLIRGPPASAV